MGNISGVGAGGCQNQCWCFDTCAENAVPGCGVVLPCLGVEALVQLHRRDHHHAKCAHHLQRGVKDKVVN